MPNCSVFCCKKQSGTNNFKKDGITYHLAEQPDNGANAGAFVPHQQMRVVLPTYPVDRYLVRGSKRIEMVNIIDDDIWKTQPALKPEDELMLSKLHHMLQSTAEELKVLSEEMSKQRDPGVQFRAMPTPLDETFNEKVHIEQVINEKFLGQKIIDPANTRKAQSDVKKGKIYNNAACQVNSTRPLNKGGPTGRLGFSKTKLVQINESTKEIDNRHDIGKQNSTSVAYNEIIFKENVEVVRPETLKHLQIQELPKIDIRGELKQQKIFNFDIAPEKDFPNINDPENSKNVAVVEINQVPEASSAKSIASFSQTEYHQPNRSSKRHTTRIMKLSTCDSSDSVDQTYLNLQNSCNVQKPINRNSAQTTRSHSRSKRNNIVVQKQKTQRCSFMDSTSQTKTKHLNPDYINSTKNHKLGADKTEKVSVSLNNKDYVPYSKLTLGGINIKEIEKEHQILALDDIPLSPLINKMIGNREDSTSDSKNASPSLDLPILSASDEHILHKKHETKPLLNIAEPSNDSKQSSKMESSSEKKYADDFEDPAITDISSNSDMKSEEDSRQSIPENRTHASPSGRTPANVSNTKISNLSFKDTVEVIEFIHYIDRQDTGTQSNLTQNRLCDTQTSPRCSTSNIRSIHNDLWPADNDSDLDCVKDISKMFKLEKDFIKQLIIDEYGDILKKGVDNSLQPSTSKNDKSSQKNTQTSPARVKSVMTSPKKLKTRTTSPLTLNLPVDQHTSPLVFSGQRVDSTQEEVEEHGVSIDLSSPRFNLRLPQSSQEVLTNLQNVRPSKHDVSNLQSPKYLTITSTSAEADSSEISSLGEIRLKMKRNNMSPSLNSLSFTSSSTISSNGQTSLILPLKSEGELTTL